MTKKLNPRVNQLHKALHGVNHPDYEARPCTALTPTERVSEVVSQLSKLGHSNSEIKESLEAALAFVSDAIEQEQHLASENALATSISARMYELFSTHLEENIARAIRIEAIYPPRHGTPTGRFTSRARLNIDTPLPAAHFIPLNDLDDVNPRSEYIINGIDIGRLEDITTTVRLHERDQRNADHTREYNHPNTAVDRHRPVHPGATIRGFRRE